MTFDKLLVLEGTYKKKACRQLAVMAICMGNPGLNHVVLYPMAATDKQCPINQISK